MNWNLIFLAVAVILFVLSAIGVSGGRINLVDAGLAFFAGSFLV